MNRLDFLQNYIHDLRPYLNDPLVTEIMVNPVEEEAGRYTVFVERDAVMRRVDDVRVDTKSLLALATDIARTQLHREIDDQRPALSASLDDGSRIAIIIPPASCGGTVMTIRKFRPQRFTLDELIEQGSIPRLTADLLCGAIRERKNVLISGANSSGKAQPDESMVLTPAGFKKIDTLSVGDEIVCQSGTRTTVTGVFPQGTKDVFRVVFEDGRCAECCDDHLWKVWINGRKTGAVDHGSRLAGWDVWPLSKIRESMSAGKHAVRHIAVPLFNPSAAAQDGLDTANLPIPPYSLGVLLGDGHFANNVEVSSADRYVLERLASELPEYKLVHISRYDYRLRIKNLRVHRTRTVMERQARTVMFTQPVYRRQVLMTADGRTGGIDEWASRLSINRSTLLRRIYNGWNVDQVLGVEPAPVIRRQCSPLMVALENLGLANLRSHDKYVPNIYKHGSAEQRLELLRGLLDTDGSVGFGPLRKGERRGTRAEFSSTSKQLALDVQELAWSMGAIASVNSRYTNFTGRVGLKKQGLKSWRVNIKHPDIPMLFALPRKRASATPSSVRYRLRIKAIEHIGQKPTRCIAVADKDGLYVTDNYVITHNTTLLNALAAVAIPRDRRIVCIEDDVREIHLDNHPNKVHLQASANYSMAKLVQDALRHRIQTVLIGEVIGEEGMALINALATGHSGSFATIHAENEALALDRLTACAMQAGQGLTYQAIRLRIVQSIHYVVQMASLRVVSLRRVGSYDIAGDRFALAEVGSN